jgi:FlaG/FlaF family flagellin (archaellin)
MPTTRRVLRDPLGFTEPYAGIKKATKAAQGAATTATNTGAKYGSEADTIGSTLVPTLKGDVTHPQGFNPTDVNNMLVAGEEGAGGATGAITGQANLEAARTHNTGALSGVLDEATREKTRALSSNALNVQNQNAMLKEKQRQAGITGLEGLYGEDVNANLKAQSLVPEDIDAWAKANDTGWVQNTLKTIDVLKPKVPIGGGGIGV